MKLKLHPHQQEAIEKMHNGCVLWGGVGTGKTIAALAYALLKEPGKPIVVVTTAKVRDSFDWEREAAKLNININEFEITSWNKINSLTEYEGRFFIFDEQRLVGSGAWVKAFYKIAAKNRWILLSATPGDTWSDYAPMFIANGWYKNITEFRREHAVYSRFTKYPKIERWVNEGKLQKYRKQLLVKMPMARHTTRHIHHIECDYDKETLDLVRKRRWNIYKDEPLRNAAELYGVMRKIVSTDPSRAQEIKKLMQEHPKLIIFYNFNYELDMLRALCVELEETLNKEKLWVSKESKTSLATTRKSVKPGSSPTRIELRPESKQTSTTQITELNKIDGKTLATKPTELTPSSKKQIQIDSLGISNKADKEPLWIPKTESQWKNSSPSKDLKKVLSPESTRSKASPETAEKILLETKKTTEIFFDWAEWNGHKHEPLPQSESWIYLVQYTSGSEGWNCVETDSMAFWSLTYSWKQFHQAQGRIDRLNTPFTDLHYYVLMTDSVAEKPVMRALEQKRDFQPR